MQFDRPIMLPGDCLQVMEYLPDNSVDLILTDPPYFKVKGEAWDRQWDKPAEFLAWLDECAKQWSRLLKPNGSLYCFASPQMSARVEVLLSERFNILNHIIWQKRYSHYGAGGVLTPARCSTPALRSYYPQSERIIFCEHYGADNAAKGEAGYAAKCDELRGFLFGPLRAWFRSSWEKSGLTRAGVNEACGSSNVAQYWFSERNYQIPTLDRYRVLQSLSPSAFVREYEDLRREYEDLRREYEDLRRPFSVSADVPYTDVWTFDTVRPYKGKHVCEKPGGMLESIITASSREGAVVLDSFTGSGATGVACANTNRKFIGIEKDNKWFKTAIERIERAYA